MNAINACLQVQIYKFIQGKRIQKGARFECYHSMEEAGDLVRHTMLSLCQKDSMYPHDKHKRTPHREDSKRVSELKEGIGL